MVRTRVGPGVVSLVLVACPRCVEGIPIFPSGETPRAGTAQLCHVPVSPCRDWQAHLGLLWLIHWSMGLENTRNPAGDAACLSGSLEKAEDGRKS